MQPLGSGLRVPLLSIPIQSAVPLRLAGLNSESAYSTAQAGRLDFGTHTDAARPQAPARPNQGTQLIPLSRSAGNPGLRDFFVEALSLALASPL